MPQFRVQSWLAPLLCVAECDWAKLQDDIATVSQAARAAQRQGSAAWARQRQALGQRSRRLSRPVTES